MVDLSQLFNPFEIPSYSSLFPTGPPLLIKGDSFTPVGFHQPLVGMPRKTGKVLEKAEVCYQFSVTRLTAP